MPTNSAKSRIRKPGSRLRQIKTCAWLERKVQVVSLGILITFGSPPICHCAVKYRNNFSRNHFHDKTRGATIEQLSANLLSPPILCFALGALARLLRSDLHLPDSLSQSISLYLLLAIGLKGGAAIAADTSGFGMALVATLILGFSIPFWTYAICRRCGKLENPEAASIAAHYGSTSAVTFLACLAYLDRNGIPYEGYMPAILAIMEVPAILVGMLLLMLARSPERSHQGIWQALHHVAVGKSILLLLGGIAIGALASSDGMDSIKPLFVDPFTGILCLFLLDLGRLTADRMHDLRQNLLFLVPFGIIAPLVHGSLAVALGTLVGLSVGGATTLGIIAGSASYIAAPAAMRVACPQGNHGISLAASLGITFPFNLALGIPLLHALAEAIARG
ncbi:MAG: sodium-dependent bicarbonate transport family permease [Planctomycetota bacterium]|nr:MAG: sodium-dependent bicarbonate transport family permease [Planctomycetota bacterium]